jgi:hypothetical protein
MDFGHLTGSEGMQRNSSERKEFKKAAKARITKAPGLQEQQMDSGHQVRE